jgi:homogentisate 1,2-dioxygenase
MLSGFGNYHQSEAIPGVLPVGQNSPQKVSYGLYAEQLSGSAFTVPRAENKRSWLYRIRPSVIQGEFVHFSHRTADDSNSLHSGPCFPNQLRWDPISFPSDNESKDFVDGLYYWLSNPVVGVYLYSANQSMSDRFFYSADGEWLIVPQDGGLKIHTEFGVLTVAPRCIAVIPRGVKFSVELLDGKARGYICENRDALFRIPDLGPIGSNGLANPRDFLAPEAAFHDESKPCELICKFQGHFFKSELQHHPLDVVGWHGNYFPYLYNLDHFNTINTVSFDHPDPSIFTVLTAPSERPGVANCDFVIFPPRWMVADHTFRPPYYHRNVMSEYMGLILGVYDAKETGFVPGGGSLHNCMSSHGPDSNTFEKALNAELKPQYLEATLAFMFESRFVFAPTRHALQTPPLQKDYLKCWQGLKRHFTGKPK